jgi:predicted MPP superfamily phosphohydrolase
MAGWTAVAHAVSPIPLAIDAQQSDPGPPITGDLVNVGLGLPSYCREERFLCPSRGPGNTSRMDQAIIDQLVRRLGRTHARQRLDIERDHEVRVFGRGLNFFHIENWHPVPWVIRNALRITGLYGRARRNAERIVVRDNLVHSERIPKNFDGFTLLQISDLHADMNEGAMRNLACLVAELSYDICVLTGDYRGKTYGPFDAALESIARVRSRIKSPVYGVLGNHDTICMVPGLEGMEIKMLLNESATIERGDEHICLVGIDDAHYYRVDNIQRAASDIPDHAFSILLSHTPEIYRQAADAGFDVVLSGHTHGGQICLPGSVPITLDSNLPRRMGSGAWHYHNMLGYTSAGVGSCIVPVRLNCRPEITLHRLRRV